MYNDVFIHEVDDKTSLDVVFKDILNLNKFSITDNDIILIKPNLCDLRSPLEGSTTNVILVEQLVKTIRNISKCRIVIVESNHVVASADAEFDFLGFRELESKYNVDLVNLSLDKKYDVFVDGYYFKKLKLAETLLKATKIINFAKLKTHAQYKITICMKNLFGLIPRKFRKEYHPFMNEVLFDLNQIFKTDLCIVDGIPGMEGFGPSEGEPKNTKLLISGTNNIATDIVCTRIMGMKIKSVPFIKFAIKQFPDIKKVYINNSKKFNKKYKFKFKFIPFYTFFFKRISLRMQRKTTFKFRRRNSIAQFLNDIGAGMIVLLKGCFVTLGTGKLRRQDAKRYGMGLLKRPFRSIKLRWIL